MYSDNQEYRKYTKKAEADKAIHSLKGILLGINLDNKVNEKEIEELKKWTEFHYELIDKNPFREFMICIMNVISGQTPTKEAIEDLFWLSQKYESDNYIYNPITTDIQTLHGICHGILADGEINDLEIHNLKKWLNKNKHLQNHYPYDELNSLILTIVCDGKIDDDERKILKAYFNEFSNIQNEKVKQEIEDDIMMMPIYGICTSDVEVIFSEKNFCITGTLKRGNRKEIENKIRLLQGKISDNINENTDYLIVGDNGNLAWAFSCYGRKVEKAIKLRKNGHKISIIHEFDFCDALDDAI